MREDLPPRDRRGEGDPDWLANGVQIVLHSLQAASHLNGELAEVCGFDDEQDRYKVKLHKKGTVKLVGKKNLRVLTSAASSAAAPSAAATANSALAVAAAPPSPAVGATGSAVPGAGEAVLVVPNTDVVRKCIQTVHRNVDELRRHCHEREAGRDPGIDLSDIFFRLHVSVETYLEVSDMFESAEGADADLKRNGDLAVERYEECSTVYERVRTWKEYMQDEVNLTKHSIKTHGLVGTLRNEVREVGSDVVSLAQDGAAVGSKVPHLVRRASTVAAETVRTHSQVATQAAGNALHEQIVAPIKRAWSLIVWGFLLCFIVPLFALRTYAPMNSVVSNLGIVYCAVVVACPPSGFRTRSAKGCLLVLWPLFLVVMPLALNYWLMHPPSLQNISKIKLPSLPLPSLPRLPSFWPNEKDGVTASPPSTRTAPAPAPPPPPPRASPPAPQTGPTHRASALEKSQAQPIERKPRRRVFGGRSTASPTDTAWAVWGAACGHGNRCNDGGAGIAAGAAAPCVGGLRGSASVQHGAPLLLFVLAFASKHPRRRRTRQARWAYAL